MKLFTMIAAAIILVSTTALADSNYFRSTGAGETAFIWLDLPSGRSTVVASDINGGKISCLLLDSATGKPVYDVKNVNVCVGHADLALPWTVLAKITNEENKTENIKVVVSNN